jgi:hypothetical protein
MANTSTANNAGVRRFRVMSDWGCESPVWTLVEDGHWAVVDADTLPIPSHLRGSLLAWQRHFEDHFRMDGGWDRPSNADWYRKTGNELADRLRRAIPDAHVELDIWPVTAAAPGS